MILASIIILALACLVIGVLQAIIGKENSWQRFLVKVLASFALLLFAIVITNLTGVINAYSLLIVIAYGLYVLINLVEFASINSQKAKQIIYYISQIIFTLLLSFSALALAPFSPFALVGGVLLGAGIGLLIWAIKKYDDVTKIVLNTIYYTAVGLFLVMSASAVIFSSHLICALSLLAGSVLEIIVRLTDTFAKESKAKTISLNILHIVAYILIIGGIYFYA